MLNFHRRLSVILFTVGGVSASVHAGIHPPFPGKYSVTPWQVHPTGQVHPPAGTPSRQVHLPGSTPPEVPPGQVHPLRGTPRKHPPDGHCSGRCASYWNTFLSMLFLCLNVQHFCRTIKMMKHVSRHFTNTSQRVGVGVGKGHID